MSQSFNCVIFRSNRFLKRILQNTKRVFWNGKFVKRKKSGFAVLKRNCKLLYRSWWQLLGLTQKNFASQEIFMSWSLSLSVCRTMCMSVCLGLSLSLSISSFFPVLFRSYFFHFLFLFLFSLFISTIFFSLPEINPFFAQIIASNFSLCLSHLFPIYIFYLPISLFILITFYIH